MDTKHDTQPLHDEHTQDLAPRTLSDEHTWDTAQNEHLGKATQRLHLTDTPRTRRKAREYARTHVTAPFCVCGETVPFIP